MANREDQEKKEAEATRFTKYLKTTVMATAKDVLTYAARAELIHMCLGVTGYDLSLEAFKQIGAAVSQFAGPDEKSDGKMILERAKTFEESGGWLYEYK